jgi:hypothetical protein
LSYYGRALSSDEVLAIYNAGSAGKAKTLPPTISSQPVGKTAIVGDTVTFSVSGGGDAPLVYQWQRNGSPVGGGASSLLTLTNVQLSQAGNYAVVISNPYGSITSSIAVLAVNPPPVPAPVSGMISWWRAESNTLDSVGFNPGSTRSVVGYAAGIVGTAFDFNGSSSYIELSNNPSLNPSGSLSIEGWIYPRVDQTKFIFSKWSGTGDYATNMSYGFEITTGRGLSFAVTDLAHEFDSTYASFGTNNVLTLNAWNHVAAIYNQATGARQIFVNGVKVAERIDPPITILSGIARVTIGANSSTSTSLGYFFNGLMDELTYYGRALSSDEVVAIYNAGSAGKSVNHSPSASNATGTTLQNHAMSIPAQKLALFASDPDGDPLTLCAVSAASTCGGCVVSSAGIVTYTPPTNFVGVDTFPYTVSDGRGGTASANVVITVLSITQPTANIMPPATVPGGFQVNFLGLPNHTYTVQRAEVLPGPWITLGTATTDGDGWGAFADTNSPPSSAYYRTTYP